MPNLPPREPYADTDLPKYWAFFSVSGFQPGDPCDGARQERHIDHTFLLVKADLQRERMGQTKCTNALGAR